MPSTLLALARGTLAGDLANRQREEERRQRDLENAIRLSSVEGLSIDDPSVVGKIAPPPAAPAAPAIPAPPVGFDSSIAGAPGAPASPLAVARGAIAPPADLPETPSDKPDVTPPDAGNRASAAPAPRSVMEVGRIRLGGKDKVINMDPSQTVGGQSKAAKVANQAAYDRLNKDGSMGAYEPGYDYRAHERKDLEEGQLTQALIDSGEDPKDAKVLAKYHIDLEGRRLKTKADLRAEERAQNADELARGSLEERKRHDRATEATAAEKKKGGPLSSNAKVAFSQVERQIGDNRTAIAAARKAMPKNALADMGIFPTPADSTAYAGAKAQTDSTVNALRARGDSLRGVSDSLAAIIQKKPAGSDQLGGKKKLSTADAARAKTDPKFAAWLRAKGLL